MSEAGTFLKRVHVLKLRSDITESDDEVREKEPQVGVSPFSEEQMEFLRTMLEDRGPSTSGKGKKLAKKPTKVAEKPGEYIGEDG